ncbi:twin-arginine translocase TatA/TatE family subunit [Leucobacter sp. HY1910]
MIGNLSGPTMFVILFIVLLLFGAPKLPGLAKSLGQSMKILKKEVRGDDAGATTSNASDAQATGPATTTATAPAAEAAPAQPAAAEPAEPSTPKAPDADDKKA